EAAGRRPDRLHDRSAAVPAGLPADPAAVHVPGVGVIDGHGRHQHGPEVPRQDDRRALQRQQEPLRGHLLLGGRRQGMSSTQTPSASPSGRVVDGPRASRPGARELLRRFLTLREGSIVVVTIIAMIYFSVKSDHFATHANFVTLLPYFAPFAILAAGEVMLMVAGEIDLSIGSVYLFAPFMFYEFNQAGAGLVLCLILSLLCCVVVGVINGVITEVFGVSSFITTLGM